MKYSITQLENDIHLTGLGKSRNAKDCGDLTVLPLGYLSEIVIAFIHQALAEERERVKEEIEKYSSMEEVVVNEQSFLRDKNENEIKIRLGTGKTLIIHDVDLEADGQAWYEEV